MRKTQAAQNHRRERLQQEAICLTHSGLRFFKTIEDGKKAETSAAELVVLCYAAVDLLKTRQTPLFKIERTTISASAKLRLAPGWLPQGWSL